MNELINFIINDASAKIKKQLQDKGVDSFSDALVFEDGQSIKIRGISFYGFVERDKLIAFCVDYVNQNSSILDHFIANKNELYKEIAQKIQEKVKG
jgi:hypothetical protein